MKRIYALIVGFALALATPAVAHADFISGPTMTRQQAVDYVIARGLAQRGVPYSWAGGNINGPSLGTGAGPAAEPAPTVAAPAPLGAGLIPGIPTVEPAPATPAAPPVVGFDSSGLMQYVFAGVGAKLPRSSGEMYKVGQKVTAAQALPGDMIFYGPEGTQSVALFIGNGQMLEATDPAVTVSPVRTNGMAPYLVRVIA
ncbi:MAG: NlpC/P60 family peptidoglycan-binding protein RipD [Mycobacterium sp.]